LPTPLQAPGRLNLGQPGARDFRACRDLPTLQAREAGPAVWGTERRFSGARETR
jgi:hypothetical protein